MPISPKKRKNSQLRGVFRDIFVSSNPDLASFGMVFVFEPENFDQKQLGTLFGIIKISDTSPESSFVANLLASVIKKEFFSKSDRPTEASFEAGLRKANFVLAELARQGSVKWVGKLSFVGGVLEKNNLHFSKLGSTAIFLLRSGSIADIGAEMGSDTAETDSHPLKTFSDISSGKVEKGDCLIFTTNDLLEIFSLEELRQNSTRFSRTEFPEIISASLNANSELSGTIILNVVPEEEQPFPIEKEIRRKKEKYTYPLPQKPIAPPSPVDILPTEPMPTRKTGRLEKLYISESDEVIPEKSAGKQIFLIARKITLESASGIAAIFKKIILLLRRIEWRRIFSSINSSFLFLGRSIKKIDWRKKNTRIFAAAIAVVIVALVIFLIFRARIDQGISPQPTTPPTQNPAPPTAPEDTNVKNIENIPTVTSLPSDSRGLIFLNDSIFVLSGEKSIVKIDPVSGGTEKIDSDIASGKFLLTAPMPNLGTIFILTDDKKVISFTPSTKKFQENSITLPGNLKAVDMKNYLTYIYLLDSSANQIYRYPRAEGGFGEKQDWLKSDADIKNTTGFAINEDLFIVDKNQISTFLKGNKNEKFNFEAPTVPLAIEKIYTAPDFENIYALDNKNHRVVQYSKEGKIIAQYWNKSISAVKDFTVDEKNKIIYLQKTDSISKFSME